MYKLRAALKFRPEIVTRPITCELIRSYDIVINILQARIFPEEEGQLILEMQNTSREDLQAGIDFLEQEGVTVQILEETIHLDRELCIDCGACTGVCKTQALTLDPKTWEIVVDQSLCLLCETCVGTCPVEALSLEDRVKL